MIPNNARHLRLTAAAGTELAVASFGVPQRLRVLGGFAWWPLTVVYTPKGFFPHAASLRQAFAHCGIFVPAASRRSLGSVSVPMWPVDLSVRLPVVALVGRYPTNKLMGHGPIPGRQVRRIESPPFDRWEMPPCGLIEYCSAFRPVILVPGVRYPCVTHPSAALIAPRRVRSRATCMG